MEQIRFFCNFIIAALLIVTIMLLIGYVYLWVCFPTVATVLTLVAILVIAIFIYKRVKK